jgi:DNA-binding LacI/PurR family transcriptional regulator
MPYLNNPLHSLHATGVEWELAKADLLVVVRLTRTKPSGTDRGQYFFDTLGTGRVDGALIFPNQAEAGDLIALRAEGTPVVLIDCVPTVPLGTIGFDAVTINEAWAVHGPTARLLAEGHRRVGLVRLRAVSLSNAPRLAG